MSLPDTLNFQPMLITDVFETMKASTAWYDKTKLSQDGEALFPFVTRSRVRNGIESFCCGQEKPAEPGNAITLGLDTQSIAYQPAAFYTSQNIQVLRHAKLTRNSALVLVSLINQQMSKFSWGGNGATLGRLKKTRIMVPTCGDEHIGNRVDWDGLDKFGRRLFAEARSCAEPAFQATPARLLKPNLDFGPMNVLEVPGRQAGLFRAHKGKRLTKANRRPGRIPFVAGSRVNNSIVDYADAPALFPGGWISLIYNGDGGTGHAKFQPVPFNAADDVIALQPLSPDATEDALMLLVTLLTQQCVPKFGFGYKLTLHRLERQKVLVPMIDGPDGDQVVDWEGMDTYGKLLRQQAEKRMRTAIGGLS